MIFASFLLACTCRYRQLFPSRQAPFLKYLKWRMRLLPHEKYGKKLWTRACSVVFEIVKTFVTIYRWIYSPNVNIYIIVFVHRTLLRVRNVIIANLSISIYKYMKLDHTRTNAFRVKSRYRNFWHVTSGTTSYRQTTLCVQLSAIFSLLLRRNGRNDDRRVVPRMMRRASVRRRESERERERYTLSRSFRLGDHENTTFTDKPENATRTPQKHTLLVR